MQVPEAAGIGSAQGPDGPERPHTTVRVDFAILRVEFDVLRVKSAMLRLDFALFASAHTVNHRPFIESQLACTQST